MRRGLLWLLFGFLSLTAVADADVRVRGYYRKDGTYVRPHMRSDPDGVFENNWTTKGNVNPYTGEPGTLVNPPDRSSGSVDCDVRVRAYTRKDGTRVRSHMRSNPDGNFYNNWSTKGNVNPYTGEQGTLVNPPDRRSSRSRRSSGSTRSGFNSNTVSASPSRRAGVPELEIPDPAPAIPVDEMDNDDGGEIREFAPMPRQTQRSPRHWVQPQFLGRGPLSEDDKATNQLELAKSFMEMERPLTARQWLERVVAEHPGTTAATEAELLLADLPTRDNYRQYLAEQQGAGNGR